MKLLKVLKSLKEPTTLSEEEQLVVQFKEWLVSEERFKGQQWRNQGARFYPSSFGHSCDRAMALKFCRAPESLTNRDPHLEITFKLGDGIHEVLQKLFKKFAEQRGWEFEDEVRIKPDENPWFISGRCDGKFFIPISALKRGIEIKSINESDFNALHKAPKADHIEQGNVYTGLLKLDYMHFIYVNKNKSTFKEFVRVLDEELFKESMMRLERILLEMQQNRFPICANCTRRCEFYELNKQRPDMRVEDIADAAIVKTITEFRPTYLRARRKAH